MIPRAIAAVILLLGLAWASEPTAGALGLLAATALADMGRDFVRGLILVAVILASGMAGAGLILARGEADARRIAAHYRMGPLPAPSDPPQLLEGEYYYEEN